MARLPRLHAPDAVQYVVQRATSGRVLFVDAEDAAVFLALLQAACRQHGFAVHAYALTSSEIHLLGTPASPKALAAILQSIGRTYVPRINRKVERSGALWERRYRSTIIDPELLLPVMQVVEAQAVRTGDGGQATAPLRSSHAHHVGVGQDSLVTDHARYWALSDTPFERQATYRRSSSASPEPGFADRVRHAVDHGWALGSPAFLSALEPIVNRRAMPSKRGRPRKVVPQNVLSPIKAR